MASMAKMEISRDEGYSIGRSNQADNGSYEFRRICFNHQ
jgi:hypothetical protein